MALTETACKNAKPSDKPRKISDGGGLFLLIQPTGSKLWRQAYRFNGKQKRSATVPIRPCRFRKRGRGGMPFAKDIDPSLERTEGRKRTRASAEITFALVAKEWFDSRKNGWTERYATRLWTRIDADIIKVIGSRPIHDIEPLEILEAVRAIEKRGSLVLAGRVLQTCGQVFRYAVAT